MAAPPRLPPTVLRQSVTCPGPPGAAAVHGLTVLSLQACWQPPEVPSPQGPRASRQQLPAPRGSAPPPRQRPRRRLRAAVAKAAPSSFPAQPAPRPPAPERGVDTRDHPPWVPACTRVHRPEHLWKVSVFFALDQTPAPHAVPTPGACGAGVAMAEGTRGNNRPQARSVDPNKVWALGLAPPAS